MGSAGDHRKSQACVTHTDKHTRRHTEQCIQRNLLLVKATERKRQTSIIVVSIIIFQRTDPAMMI